MVNRKSGSLASFFNSQKKRTNIDLEIFLCIYMKNISEFGSELNTVESSLSGIESLIARDRWKRVGYGEYRIKQTVNNSVETVQDTI